MNENNVKLGEIRLEDSFHEAKISEPIQPRCPGCKCNPKVEKNDTQPESQSVLPIQGTGAEHREG